MSWSPDSPPLPAAGPARLRVQIGARMSKNAHKVSVLKETHKSKVNWLNFAGLSCSLQAGRLGANDRAPPAGLAPTFCACKVRGFGPTLSGNPGPSSPGSSPAITAGSGTRVASRRARARWCPSPLPGGPLKGGIPQPVRPAPLLPPDSHSAASQQPSTLFLAFRRQPTDTHFFNSAPQR